ncbi:peptidase M50B-like protein [Haloactinospora alba]|uniref:Peptidase M50B-like protein n=2 Tax=Haloactinospora alba TaxID=405555 RepID=A0A543NM21_9ACTN|nr:peptidase M50B-like protein [Haloactinospora alba]
MTAAVVLSPRPGAALGSTARALLTATAPVWLPAGALAAVSALLGWLLPTVLTVSLLLLLASVLVHEAGHVAALRVLAPATPAVFRVDATGAGVCRPPLADTRREVAVVLAGPLAPAVVWTLGTALGAAAGGVPAAAVVWTGIVALGHPVSLLFPVGDTRTLLRALTR